MPLKSDPKPPSMRKPDATDSDEDQAWLEMPPIGREFGSPDYERLTEVDQAAFAAFQSWEKVRHWLSTPHPKLDGLSPDEAMSSANGLNKVLSLLTIDGRRVGDD